MVKKRKHILFLTSWYPDRILIDNGDFIQRHAQAISLHHDVTVVHAIKDPNLKGKKFEIESSEQKGLKEIIVYFKPSKISAFNLLLIIQAYLIGTKSIKPFDLIHLNVVYPAGLVAVYLKYKYKKNLILTEHWTQLHPENFKTLAKYKQTAIRRILDSVDLVLPVSKHLGESIKKINPSINYKVIPNVVDLSKFTPRKTLPTGRIKFLHLSHLGDQHKNISGMLHVAKQLANDGYEFEFQIGGNGDLQPIHEFVKTNNLDKYIFPFGRLEHHEVNQKMNDSDCFVLFSRYENQPCVQAEAFACGLPIIATNVGGINEYLPNNFGILIDSENENQLYDAMKSVIEGKDFAAPKAMHNYAKEHFSKEEISLAYDKIYNELNSSKHE
ncbi:glycosyltransferase family 4 protein [Faecalibacter bovis]|uniref:Glycosyltransferase family 4 protein n=1 Tax=Faecalibacter bovis TaxID=2898187 RepID=A0ABX7XEV8_9FLAO|nr:glycosyltransferase family 4 protein [Faecalibacter bovis]QTV06453.1 glycosyltransferase family 4 protein [Faecalibacter bovis]